MTNTFTENCCRGARRAPRLLALLATALLAGAFALPCAALADDTPTRSELKHVKAAEQNVDDGTATVTLNVTGDTDETKTPLLADVIVVQDISGSMNYLADKVDEANLDKTKTYFGQLDDSNNTVVELSYKEGTRWQQAGWYYTGDWGWTQRYSGTFYASSKTRLDVAKSALATLADSLIADEDSGIQISLVTFSTNSNAASSFYEGGQAEAFKTQVNNLSAKGGTNWEAALKTANGASSGRAGAKKYIVFLSDGDPTYRDSQYSADADDRRAGYNVWGNGNSDPDGRNYGAAKDVANNRGSAGMFVVSASTDATQMNSFASDVNGTYLDGTSEADLKKAFAKIIETITTSVAYKDVVIEDTLSSSVEFVLAEGQTTPVFTYMKNGEVWNDAPAATVDKNGKVTWNLSTVGKLEKGVTYSVSFNVQPTQKEFDNAANAEGTYSVYTNAANGAEDKSGSLTYKTVTDVDGKETESESITTTYGRPSIDVATSTIKVAKTWKGTGTAPDSLTVTLTRDDGDVKTVVLTKGNNWTADVKVSAGPEGHTYTVTEAVPTDWTSDQPEGGHKITLKGLTAQSGSASFTNTFTPYGLSIFKYTAGEGGAKKPLQGATFTVTGTIDGKAVEYTLTTDATGYAKTTDAQILLDGEYTITETSVPAGYDKLSHSLTLTVTGDKATLSDGTQTADVTAEVRYFQISVSNTPSAPATIPSTGGMGDAPLYIVGMAVIAAAVTLLVKRLS